MTRPIPVLGAVAAVAVLIVGGVGLLNRQSGVGTLPTPSPTAAATPMPTATPTVAPTAAPTATPVPTPQALLMHPLPAPDDALAVTLTAPDKWEVVADSVLVPSGTPGTGAPGGVAIQLLDITSVNSDACHWKGQDGDIDLGQTVDDLARALRQQTALQASKPVAVTLGGYSGKRVVVVAPTEPYVDLSDAGAPSCDDGHMQPWTSTAFGEEGVHMQGPANRWQVNILDVAGTRFVVVAQDFPGTSAADRAKVDAVLDSLVITP